jgi:hypothetical protein
MFSHDGGQLLAAGFLRIPAQLLSGFGRISPEVYDVCRAEPGFIDRDQHLPGLLVVALLVDTVAAPFQFDAHFLEGQCGKLAHSMILTRGNHEIIRFRLLEDEPHTLDIVPGIAPVAK